ncbi:MAG: Ig-like domain-containing protein, partial [Clostridiales bacterium]|nr:Ig-like domain-containing protein [Clostridiales bacterium]
KGIGTANITVMTESGRKGTIKVYVVGLSKTKLTLPQYTETEIKLEVDGAGASSLRPRWDVENQEIATVVNGKVKARALGTTYVYAVVNGRRLTCKVTVIKIP